MYLDHTDRIGLAGGAAHARLFRDLATILLIFAYTSAAQAPRTTGSSRVDALLGQMTLEEKISLVHGSAEDPAMSAGEAGFLPGVPRLGIPSLRIADGPPGVAVSRPSTAL